MLLTAELKETQEMGTYITGRKYNVKLEDIQVRKGFNKRIFNESYQIKINELAESISEVGIRQPLKVKVVDGSLVLIDGETRLRAAKSINYQELIPIVIASYKSEKEELLDQGLANNGNPFTPYEWALLYQALSNEGMTATEIAKSYGVSVATVSNRLQLLKLDDSVLSKVSEGLISADNVVKLMREHPVEEINGIIDNAINLAANNGKAKAGKKEIDQVKTTTNDGEEKPKKEKKESLKELLTTLLLECDKTDYAQNPDKITIEIDKEDYEKIQKYLQK